MAEEEINNKIRLNQVRRETVENKINKADGIRDNMNGSEKFRRREGLYGKENEKKETKKYTGKLAKIAAPLAAARKAKDLVTAPTEFRIMDVFVYGLAMALAFLKDLLDLAFIGSLPAIGTVITFCISIAIGFVLLFDGVTMSKRKVARRLTKKFLILIAGTIVEGVLFGLNFLPFEMLTVGIIYWMSLVDRKSEKRMAVQEAGED
ncbi:MAG: hypothetical protein WC682_02150 [Parcubacteria group bacterium]|jgi:hypothetical protein